MFGVTLVAISAYAEMRHFMVVQRSSGSADTLWVENVDSVSFESFADSIDGQPYVDMGGSVLWANYNIGANNKGVPGNFYAWGESETKDYFFSSTYTVDESKEDAYQDPVALAWGGGWIAARRDHYIELFTNVTIKAVNYSVAGKTQYGLELTSKINHNKLFFPIAGYVDGRTKMSLNRGFYWCPENCTFEINVKGGIPSGLLSFRGANVRGVIVKK